MSLNRFLRSLLGTLLLAGCSREIPLVFYESPDGAWRVEKTQMDAWARSLPGLADAEIKERLDKAYSAADSLSLREDPPRTLEIFASEVADRFLAAGSPLWNDHVYELALDREIECRSWLSWGRRSSEYRRWLLNLNRPGYPVSDIWLSCGGGAPDTLLRKLMPAAPLTVLFIYGQSCSSCERLVKEISRSGDFREMAAGGGVQFLSIYTGEDEPEFAARAASLPSYWQNWFDRERVVFYAGAFDMNRVPSLYIVDKDANVVLRGARSVRETVKKLKKL